MIIESLHIDHFGCLSDFSCRFDERMNIIFGENESGKSTLSAFIRYMLYGFTGRGDLQERKKRLRWESGRAGGSMTVRVGDRRFRIERSTVLSSTNRGRETYRENGSIVDLENRMPLAGNTGAGERFLGVPEEVYLHTAFVGQVSTKIGGSELNEAIENLLFSGDENLNVQRALDKLEAVRRALLHKNGKGGELYDLEVRAAGLSHRLEMAGKENSQLLYEEAKLTTAREKLREAQKKAAAAEARVTEEESAVLLEAYGRLHAAEKTLSDAEGALRHLDGLPAYRLHESDLSDLAHARGAVETAEVQLSEARARRAGYTGAGLTRETTTYLEKTEKVGSTDDLRARVQKDRKTRLLYAVVGGTALTLALLFWILGGVAPALFGGAALPLVLGSVAAAVTGVFGFRAIRAHQSLLSLFRQYGALTVEEFMRRMEEVDRGRENVQAYRTAAREAYEAEKTAKAAYDRAMGELDTVVHRFDTRLPEEGMGVFLDALVENARRVMEKKKEHEKTILQAQSVVDALHHQLAGKNEAAARASLPQDREIDLETLKPEESRRDRDMYAAQVRVLTEQVHALDKSVLSLRAKTEDPATLRAELDNLQTHIRELRERHDACLLAYEAISGAGERLRAEVSPRLSDFACHMMEALTDGRYTRVGVDGKLDVSFGTGDSTHALDHMSTGTQDLAYLSLRMALIDLLYEEKPPVCFDESFAFQDDGRTARLLTALVERAATGQQNLVFTCHEREKEAAQAALGDAHVIVMPTPVL